MYVYVYMYICMYNQWLYSNWCTLVQPSMVFSVHLHLNLDSSFS